MTRTLLFPLTHLGLIRARGEDARSFLQGQLSNDVRRLDTGLGQLTSYNSPKGRMLAVLQLIADGDDVLIELPRSVLPAVLKRLRLYVLRARLTLDDVSDAMPPLGLAGPQAAALLAAQGLTVPLAPQQCCRAGGRIVLRRLGDTPRYTLYGPPEALDALRAAWRDLAAGSDDDWRRLDILAGVPTVVPETSDHFVPQMANLDRLGGISFDKGCYTGQEIVARLHYLGQLKRRMFQGRVDGPGTVAPGTDVYDAEDPQAVGEVVQAVPDGDGQLLSLVLQLNHAQSPSLRLGGTPSRPVTVYPAVTPDENPGSPSPAPIA
ncbi:MAG: folate-binding protein [Nevskiaceae bacterium]|nr:MAG: folate-binding protein [Nevskiaceae bacterium]